ncbi:MAG: hypothetical protein IKT65_01465, partial [Clostridia bacterium]|nr:hypothetical protein [Clostridia bacterium]
TKASAADTDSEKAITIATIALKILNFFMLKIPFDYLPAVQTDCSHYIKSKRICQYKFVKNKVIPFDA